MHSNHAILVARQCHLFGETTCVPERFGAHPNFCLSLTLPRLSLNFFDTTLVAIHKKFLNSGKQHWTWLTLKDVNGSLLCHIPQHQILRLFAVAQKDPTSSRKCIHTFQKAKWGRHGQAEICQDNPYHRNDLSPGMRDLCLVHVTTCRNKLT